MVWWERGRASLGPEGELYVRGTGDDAGEVKRLTQRCFACHRCKVFFVGIKRIEKPIKGTLPASARPLIDDRDPD